MIDPDSGRVVPRGTPGELCTRGYVVMLGYWDDPEARTASARRGPRAGTASAGPYRPPSPRA